jgi:hypothetical protein
MPPDLHIPRWIGLAIVIKVNSLLSFINFL